MEQEAIYFGKNGITKSAFHKNKSPININEVDIERTKLSDKKKYSKDSLKYFIVYRHEGNAFPFPLYIKHTGYYDENNKYIILSVSNKKILEKYSEIWNKVNSFIKK